MAVIFNIRVDDTAVRGWLDSLLYRLRNTAPALDEIGDHMRASVEANFASEHEPSGRPWAPLSPVTLARRRRRGNLSATILTDTGALRRSITVTRNSARTVVVSSSLPYSAMQQYGGTKARFPHLWGDIPARPYIGYAPGDEESIAEIMRAHLRALPFTRRSRRTR